MRSIYTPVSHLVAYFGHLGIPLASTSYDASVPLITVEYAPEATPEQIAQGDAILADWDYRYYRTRSLWDILQDVNALTNAQKDEISIDLMEPTSGPTPPKALATEASNSIAIFCTYATLALLSWTSADARKVKCYSYALYVQDDPYYLVQPPYDTSINVPGLEAVTSQ